MKLKFWRYGIKNDKYNAQKYGQIHPKVRQAAKTAKIQFSKRVEELGYDSRIWTVEELNDYSSELDNETWLELNSDKVIRACYKKIRLANQFKNSNSYHTPPLSRGTYAFPPKLVEWFLILWKRDGDESTKLSKHIVHSSNGKVWCHFGELAKRFGVQILRSTTYWIEVSERDYLYLLKKAVAETLEEARTPKTFSIIHPHNLSKFTGLDHFEVFLEVA